MQCLLGLLNYYLRFMLLSEYRQHVPILQEALRLADHTQPDDEALCIRAVASEARAALLAFTDGMKLSLPDPGEKLILDTDASDSAFGAILSVEREGKELPVAFLNRALSKAERNYPTIKRELLAIGKALRRWPYLILGHPLTIRTDHQALTHLAPIDTIHRKVCGLILEILAFNPTVIWRAGKDHGNADSLSRLTHLARCRAPDDHLFRRVPPTMNQAAEAVTHDAIVGFHHAAEQADMPRWNGWTDWTEEDDYIGLVEGGDSAPSTSAAWENLNNSFASLLTRPLPPAPSIAAGTIETHNNADVN